MGKELLTMLAFAAIGTAAFGVAYKSAGKLGVPKPLVGVAGTIVVAAITKLA